MEPIYRPLAVVVKTAVRVMRWRVLIDHNDGIPAEGPAILACNHVSYLDPIMLGLAVERRGRLPRYMAKRELFEVPVFGAMLRQMRHVPVDRRGDAARSLDAAVERLREGYVLGVFPEATIRPVFDPANGKTGAARLALATGAPLIPVGLWGGQAIATKGDSLHPRPGLPLAVHVGEPVDSFVGEDATALTWRLMEQIGVLADQARSRIAAASG